MNRYTHHGYPARPSLLQSVKSCPQILHMLKMSSLPCANFPTKSVLSFLNSEQNPPMTLGRRHHPQNRRKSARGPRMGAVTNRPGGLPGKDKVMAATTMKEATTGRVGKATARHLERSQTRIRIAAGSVLTPSHTTISFKWALRSVTAGLAI